MTDSTTDSEIVGRLSVLNMFNILKPLELADRNRPTIAVGRRQIGLVGTGLYSNELLKKTQVQVLGQDLSWVRVSFRVSFWLKPIFHCDAKPFALGTGVGLDPQRHTLASPNAKDTKMLVSINAKTPDAKPKICVT